MSSSDKPGDEKPNDERTAFGDWEFYHALYHHLAHWAAYIAMMGFLITSGVLICTTTFPTGHNWVRKGGLALAVIAGLGGALQFAKGMRIYGGVVNRKIWQQYLLDIQKPQRRWMPWHPFVWWIKAPSQQVKQHESMVFALYLAAVLCGCADMALLVFADADKKASPHSQVAPVAGRHVHADERLRPTNDAGRGHALRSSEDMPTPGADRVE